MKFYQVVITLYRYDWFNGKWKPKQVFPSPVIHESEIEADQFLKKFPDILKRRGWNLKKGNWGWSIEELHLEPKPTYGSPINKQ